MFKKILHLLVLIGLISAFHSCKKISSDLIANIESYQEDHFIEIPRENGMYRIQFLSDQTAETSFVPNGEKYISESHAVVLSENIVDAMVEETKNTVVYATGEFKVEITKEPFGISYKYKDKELISEKKGYLKTDSTEILNFNLDNDEVIYGVGARVLGMNRRGHRLQLYNRAHYGYETRSELMNYTMPLIMSSKIYAVHFDNPQIGYLDIDSKKDNTLSYETIGGRKTYQVVAGDDWKDLMDAYSDLTGKQPLPPRWAFGNFASRFGYHSQEEVEKTVSKFKKDSIPLDAVILDIYWFGKDIKGHMGNLEFLRDSFPDPKKMINDLAAQHIKTILITEPFILTSSSKWEEAAEKGVLGKDSIGKPYTYDFYFGNTGIVDIYDPKGKDWFWNIYKTYTKEYGVAGWWGDLGEPEVHPSDLLHATGTADEVHNIYGHDWAQLVYNGYLKDFPEQRPFILMRAGYSGSQRFGMIPWSGDVSRSWGGLKPQTEIALSMGMQGLGYMHSDLGGFAGGEVFDPELYVRWLQYGVFQPIYRPHAQEHIAPEPVFHDPKTKALAKKSIELRYALLPYNYTLAFENNQTGMPLMRPLFFEEADNAKLLNLADTYLWGDAFLVSPIVNPGVISQDVYFPEGNNWFDFFSGKLYKGGSFANVTAAEDHIPTFVKGGAFIPMIKPIMNTEAYTTKNLKLHYYFDPTVTSSSGKLYDDDGITPSAFEKGQYELLTFKSKNAQNSLYFIFTAEVGSSQTFTNREIELYIHNVKKSPKTVSVNNNYKEFVWNEQDQSVTILLNWSQKEPLDIDINF